MVRNLKNLKTAKAPGMAREGLESPINSPTRQFGIAPAELGHRLLQQQDPNLFSQWPGEGWNLRTTDGLKVGKPGEKTRHWTASSDSARNKPREFIAEDGFPWVEYV